MCNYSLSRVILTNQVVPGLREVCTPGWASSHLRLGVRPASLSLCNVSTVCPCHGCWNETRIRSGAAIQWERHVNPPFRNYSWIPRAWWTLRPAALSPACVRRRRRVLYTHALFSQLFLTRCSPGSKLWNIMVLIAGITIIKRPLMVNYLAK